MSIEILGDKPAPVGGEIEGRNALTVSDAITAPQRFHERALHGIEQEDLAGASHRAASRDGYKARCSSSRYGDRLTLEQALVDDQHIPAVGTCSGGCDRDIAEIMLARARRHWVDGEVPAEETVPLRLRDVYGLSEFVKLAPEENAERGRPYDAQLDQACDPNP